MNHWAGEGTLFFPIVLTDRIKGNVQEKLFNASHAITFSKYLIKKSSNVHYIKFS
jgi:hypothetical protein